MTPQSQEDQLSIDKEQFSIQDVESYAKSSLNKHFESSIFLNRNALLEADLPILNDRELIVGNIVGKGLFSEVRLVESHIADVLSTNHEVRNVSVLDGMNANAIKSGSRNPYVIKKLTREILTDEDQSKYRINAINQIIQEVYWMSTINHPNILQLRGLSLANTIGETGLIFDTLQETLDRKIIQWGQNKKYRNFRMLGKTKLLFDQLVITSDLAGAIKYLREQRIIHRDIKPTNVGLVGNHVKLFDFGTAREVTLECDGTSDHDTTYKLTAQTGSFRYMAPEVAKSAPYNFKADVFSFSILLYEIFALEKPFLHHDFKKYLREFHLEGLRPKLKPKWPVEVQDLLTKGWAPSALDRPCMMHMEKVLRTKQHQVEAYLKSLNNGAHKKPLAFRFGKTRTEANCH